MQTSRLLTSLLLLMAACGGGSQSASVRPVAALRVVSGGTQSGVAGRELPAAILVKVVDVEERPVQGQLVNFRITSGGGSVFAGSSISNADGIVQERWTLGSSTALTQTLEARAVDNATGAPLVFAAVSATAVADVPASIHVVSGDRQRTLTGTGGPLPLPLVVNVVDQYGNPAAGAEVVWSPQAGDSANPGLVAVDAEGHASTEWTLGGAVGEHLMSVQVGGLATEFIANWSCPTTNPRIATGGVPACTGIQAGAPVTVSLGICPRCDQEFDSCVVTLPSGDNIIQLDPLVLVCSPNSSCPVNPSCAPVTCTFTAPAAGSYQLLVLDPDAGQIAQPFTTVATDGASSCGA